MQYRTWVTCMSMSVVLSGMLLAAPLAVRAQERAPAQSKEESCPMCQKHMHKKSTGGDERAERRQMHEQMEAMHREMTRELQQQLTTIRDHSKAMEGVSDQTQLLGEMKKHQQLTDTLLGTMIEQHQKMHATMQEHHKHMHSAMTHEHQAPESATKPERAE